MVKNIFFIKYVELIINMDSSNLFGNKRNFMQINFTTKGRLSTITSPKLSKVNKYKRDTCQVSSLLSVALTSSCINMIKNVHKKADFPEIIHSTPRYNFPKSKSESIIKFSKGQDSLKTHINIFNKIPVIYLCR